MTLGIWDIDWYIRLVKKQDKLEDVPVEGGAMQEIVTLVIGNEGVGAVLQQQVDNVEITFLRCP